MKTEMGEYIVGAYLKMIKECDFIDYNVRRPGGGLKGLDELDVIGLNFNTNTAYLCEVTTHIRGLVYKDNKTTISKINSKYEKQQSHAKSFLPQFDNHIFMFWSPVVPRGYLTDSLSKIKGLDLVINERYTECIDEMRAMAKTFTGDSGNPFFRILQILEHLRS